VNTGLINGFSFNGAAYPNWVISAVVTAVAAASFSATPTRITYASAVGNANVSVTLTQTRVIAARANATASATVAVFPTIRSAGRSVATATATGHAAVRRDVYATAGGDARCYGEALTAQALGNANATMAATVVLAKAHMVFPGRSNTQGTATGTAQGNVKRYPTVRTGLSGSVYANAEPSVKRNGHSYFDHIGYATGSSRAVSSVPQDRIKVIATFGAFDFAESNGTAKSFIRYAAHSLGTGVAVAESVVARHIYWQKSTAQATALATSFGTRVVNPTAQASAQASSYAPKARANYFASCTGSGGVTATALAKRTAKAAAESYGYAVVAKNITYGMQHFAGVAANATGSGLGSAKQLFAATAGSTASGSVIDATGTRKLMASVSGVMASATVGMAYAIANSEIKAPDERYMMVSAEDRVMYVQEEDRTMVVTV